MNKLGICLDHSNAILIEIVNNKIVQNIISSEFTHDEKEFSLSKGENLMHNKQQHQKSGYYKKIIEVIKKYQEVLIFGPTEAKNELFNLIKTNHLLHAIKFEVKHSDKMSEAQMHMFVKDYFKPVIAK